MRSRVQPLSGEQNPPLRERSNIQSTNNEFPSFEALLAAIPAEGGDLTALRLGEMR